MNTQDQPHPPPHPQANAASLPMVTENQQRDMSLQPVVLVNQQLSDRQTFLIQHPYFHRGAQLPNGCRINGIKITIFFTMGGLLIISGFVSFILGMYHGILMLIIGGTLVGLGVYFLRTAKAQFNSLPLDHPDRVNYSVPYVLVAPSHRQGREHQLAHTYTAPPMQHQVMTYASPPEGHLMYYPAQPTWQGQASATPPLATNNTPFSPVDSDGPFVTSRGAAPEYQPSLQASYVPENDPPPAYSDVVKEA